jgi:hypothetical protein
MDGLCGATRGGPAGVVSLFGRRVLIEQDDNSVIVSLIKNLDSVHHAVARGCAFILVHSHFHFCFFNGAV